MVPRDASLDGGKSGKSPDRGGRPHETWVGSGRARSAEQSGDGHRRGVLGQENGVAPACGVFWREHPTFPTRSEAHPGEGLSQRRRKRKRMEEDIRQSHKLGRGGDATLRLAVGLSH